MGGDTRIMVQTRWMWLLYTIEVVSEYAAQLYVYTCYLYYLLYCKTVQSVADDRVWYAIVSGGQI